MREIGGYIELDHYRLPMLHEDAIALNCGRNCLAYLFKSRGIKKLKIPYLICDSIFDICDREGVKKEYYHVGMDFKPKDVALEDDEWLYLVNYYGQYSNEEIQKYANRFGRVIVDQANDYFQIPLPKVDTIYTCRKWFGVADGAFLYTDHPLGDVFPQDQSYDRMLFLLGRYERTASEFYTGYTVNNRRFKNEPIKTMSMLTRNLLHAIDYEDVAKRRRENFEYLHERLGKKNMLKLKSASFMYPFMVENGSVLRKRLQAEKIYIPTLWPAVFKVAGQGSVEYRMAEDILPLPIDQRYGMEDMDYILGKIESF